jgi:Tfp pilus assembly PilM family ATPase
LDFHQAQTGASDVTTVVLTGQAVSIPGFSAELGERLGLPLEVGVAVEGRPGALTDADAGRFAVAAGLTMGEVA